MLGSWQLLPCIRYGRKRALALSLYLVLLWVGSSLGWTGLDRLRTCMTCHRIASKVIIERSCYVYLDRKSILLKRGSAVWSVTDGLVCRSAAMPGAEAEQTTHNLKDSGRRWLRRLEEGGKHLSFAYHARGL
jgi:hypothetical protein